MGVSIGIDLGTTNSVAAYTNARTHPFVIPTQERDRETPSVVSRNPADGRLLVGSIAVNNAIHDPRNFIHSIKRLIGRFYFSDPYFHIDPEIGKLLGSVGYKIVPQEITGHDASALVVIGEREYWPEEIAALILEKIKVDAEAALGQEVTHAVITVPAYFHDGQRWAMRRAGELAGLKVTRIIDEPVAATYAFGMDLDPSASKTVIVYDLGGSHFDVSIVWVSEGIPTVEHIEGDNWLGGDNFDSMIIDYVLSQMSPGLRDELRHDPVSMWDLKQKAEEAKRDLGQAMATDITMYGALKGKVDVDVTIHRADFESWIRTEIEGSVALVEKAMDGPGFKPDDIDHVLLVGGSTAIPLVRRLLAQKFGQEKITAIVDPMECVALGAAIQAARTLKKICVIKTCNFENELDAASCGKCGANIGEAEAMVKCNFCGHPNDKQAFVCQGCGKNLIAAEGGVTAKPYGIGVEGDRFQIIVPKGTRYPTSEPMFREFKTVADFQERIVFPIFQGFEEVASKNELQCEIVLPEKEVIPEDKRVRKGTPLDIGFSIDENGILTVEVRGKGELAWLQFADVVRPWEGPRLGDTEPEDVPCPRCNHRNRRGATACQECGEALTPRGGGEQVPEWKQGLYLPLALAQAAIHDCNWAIQPAQIRDLQSVADRVRRALDTEDEATGRLIKPELDRILDDACRGIYDLVEASWVFRAGIGALDQNRKLGAMLEEYKQRFLRGEDPRSPAMEELRFEKIKRLMQEIIEGLGDRDKVECKNCHQLIPPPTPSRRTCPNCGSDQLGVTT